MVIRELTYQLHKLEASESALVSADHHDKKSVLGIGGKNPDRSIPCLYEIELMMSKSRAADTLNARAVCRLERFSFSIQESVVAVFESPVHRTENCFFLTHPI